MTTTLPKIALPPCPSAGKGVHRWVFICCLKLHGEEIEPELWEQYIAPKSSRPLQPGEIENAAKTILSGQFTEGPRWEGTNILTRASILRGAGSMEDLARRSAYTWEDGGQHTREILELLFPGDPLLCCGASSRAFATKRLSDWGDSLSALQFIVPSPMLATHGTTQAGKKSAHTLENTGPRKYQVVEFDEGTFDDHAKLLNFLTLSAPLVLVVHSGGKSLHGWFRMDGKPEAVQEKFFQRALHLGADRATWTRSQFVRMPDGQRANGAIQRAIYFHPTAP